MTGFNFRLVLRAAMIILLGITAGHVVAKDAPNGRVLLEISGAIAETNGSGVMRYDREMLESLGTHDIVTETPWTEGLSRFTGVFVRDVLQDVGALGNVLTAAALNDFKVDIPVLDFDSYDAIFAFERNGHTLTVREKGPLWIIYPWSDFKSLQNQVYYSRSVWQLHAIHILPE